MGISNSFNGTNNLRQNQITATQQAPDTEGDITSPSESHAIMNTLLTANPELAGSIVSAIVLIKFFPIIKSLIDHLSDFAISHQRTKEYKSRTELVKQHLKHRRSRNIPAEQEQKNRK